MKIYVLEQELMHEWFTIDYFNSYEAAQRFLNNRVGFHRIREVEVKS